MTKLNRTSAGAVMNACLAGNAFDGQAIARQIKFIAQTGPKLDATIHGVAVACIGMSMPHSEGGHNCAMRAVQLVNTLADLNKSARTKALVAWFHAFSNIRLRKDDKTGKYVGSVMSPKLKGYRSDISTGDAMATPFWSVEEKSSDPADFFLGDAIAKLIKRAAGKVETQADKDALASLERIAKKASKAPVAADA
jgi:hypothetical protein